MTGTLAPATRTIDSEFSGQRRLRRRAAVLAARCAMASWLLLAAMPIIVVVCSLS